MKNYDDLRRQTMVPRILVVLLMPQELDEWVQQTPEELCLRHCAYWMSLEGQPDLPNTTSVTVRVPTTQVFSSDQLTDMMRKAENGDALC